MSIEIGPLQIAAIVSASIAVILIIFVVFYRLYRRRQRGTRASAHHSPTSSTSPLSPSQHSRSASVRGTSMTTSGLGSATNVLTQNARTPIAPTPSTGQTVLVTPSTGGGYGSSKLKKMMIGAGGGKSSPADKHESAELVVITYEDGLRKLGIDPNGGQPHPHHILYPEYDEGEMDNGSQVRAVDSPRAKPGRDRGKAPPPALEK
ncbi:hypothetical protein B9479_003357 [Cryptococcus floricola]|uniref:Uncharacterized protein n=1 Tax=Cryptococcus floricola TaxID=2591691 RepID=A0A5D3AYP2_9TREE|nr:hypothetical protein B9479_003357 [Cryptococcus floricola]